MSLHAGRIARFLKPSIALALGFICAAIAPAATRAATLQTLHEFNGTNGFNPTGGLLAGPQGVLYGVTFNGGASGHGLVFKFNPITERITTLYSFPGGIDGQYPRGVLLLSRAGVLYGTAGGGNTARCHGDDCGIVFELTPPASGKTVWKRTVLHRFRGSDGWFPNGALIMDKAGALYGATTYGGNKIGKNNTGYGVVFKLTPPASAGAAWTETVLHSFAGQDGKGPNGGLILDTSGILYGSAVNGGPGGLGVIYTLSPAGSETSWTETTIATFGSDISMGGCPMSGLIRDASGALYGTGACGGPASGGVVFKLMPPAAGNTSWTEAVLASYATHASASIPDSVLLMEASGALYGMTAAGGSPTACRYQQCGAVFKLSPPSGGSSAWTQTVAYQFTHGAQDTASNGGLILPTAGLVKDSAGALYGTTWEAGNLNCNGTKGCGMIYKLTP